MKLEIAASLAIVGAAAIASADTKVWTGLGPDAKASTAANWQADGGADPGHTLFIHSLRHALGVNDSQIVPGGTSENPGKIVWLTPPTMLLLR